MWSFIRKGARRGRGEGGREGRGGREGGKGVRGVSFWIPRHAVKTPREIKSSGCALVCIQDE